MIECIECCSTNLTNFTYKLQTNILYLKKITLLIFFFATTAFRLDDFREEDKIRINEAIRILDHCENLWSGWDSINFAILLVTDNNEYLMYQCYDPVLTCPAGVFRCSNNYC